MGINLDTGGVCVITGFTGTTATGIYSVSGGETSADLTATSVVVNTTARDAALNDLDVTLPVTNIASIFLSQLQQNIFILISIKKRRCFQRP